MRVMGGARGQWVAAEAIRRRRAPGNNACFFAGGVPSPSHPSPRWFFFFFRSSERNLKGGLCNVPFFNPGAVYGDLGFFNRRYLVIQRELGGRAGFSGAAGARPREGGGVGAPSARPEERFSTQKKERRAKSVRRLRVAKGAAAAGWRAARTPSCAGSRGRHRSHRRRSGSGSPAAPGTPPGRPPAPGRAWSPNLSRWPPTPPLPRGAPGSSRSSPALRPGDQGDQGRHGGAPWEGWGRAPEPWATRLSPQPCSSPPSPAEGVGSFSVPGRRRGARDA